MSKWIISLFFLIITGSLYAQEVKVIEDLRYFESEENDPKHLLDLYLPADTQEAPMMLWIHGGAWAFGDRKKEKELAMQFVREGVAVAVASYRLSPGTWADPKFNTGIQHPEHIKDIARAFTWVHKHATEYGYSQNNLFVSGYSAGGHLSALLAADGQYLEAEGLSTEHIKGIIPIAGAYDISHYHQAHLLGNGPEMAEKHVQAVFGDTEEDFAQASPTTFVQNLSTPIFLISERQSYDYTIVFEEAIKKAGIANAQFLHVRDFDHKGLYYNLAQASKSDYRDQILAFIKQVSVTTLTELKQ